MREFDLNGLRLAEYQAQLFEYSAEHLECSSAVFLRRFLHSDLLKILDLNESSRLSLDIKEGIEKIVIAGGGANNKYIIKYLQDNLDYEVVKSDINDEMEAIGFALLGYATLNNIPSNVKSVTGARDNVILGNITKAPLK